MATILVTGGCGYIGSHTVLELLNKNYDVVVVDNFSNSSFESIRRVQKITGKEVTFYEADIRDQAMMEKIFDTHKFDAVIHFAAFKAVGESCKLPLKYYENNISGTVSLLQIMERHNVKKIIFSSSATVYGDPEKLPSFDDQPLRQHQTHDGKHHARRAKSGQRMEYYFAPLFQPRWRARKRVDRRRSERYSQQFDAVRGASGKR